MFLAANGVWIWTTLAVIIWIALAFWPARVAARKGHSFFGYFLFSLVFFPAALIVAYMVQRSQRPERERRRGREGERGRVGEKRSRNGTRS